MKIVVIGGFLLWVTILLAYVYFTILELREMRYGRCWSIIRMTINDIFDKQTADYFQGHVRRWSEFDSHVLDDHIFNYAGHENIDLETNILDKDSHFFKTLKLRIVAQWHQAESPLLEILDEAIYAYNIDTQYTITPRQFLNYLSLQFKQYFISKL